MEALEQLFAQTTSPNPDVRRAAENQLGSTISSNPGCALDVLHFATDWGNLGQNNNNITTSWVYSRLAAAIFLKNMILRSPWGTGDLERVVANRNNNNNNQQQQQQQHASSLSLSLFSTFLPPPPLQQEIRNSLVIAMVNWRPPLGQQQQQQQQQHAQAAPVHPAAFVEETILRLVQTTIEAIHDADWPAKWPDLFDQAVAEFSTNALVKCEEALGVFSTWQKNNNNNGGGGGNFFDGAENIDGCLSFAESLFRGAAALCIVKLCCKRLFDPEDSNASQAVDDGTTQQLLLPLGKQVLVPFLRVVSSPQWSQLFVHASFAENNSSSNNNAAAISVFQRAWAVFGFEGLKSIFHLSQTQIFAAMLDATAPVAPFCVFADSTADQQAPQEQPFVFATAYACTRIHHGLLCRLLLRRESVLHQLQQHGQGRTSSLEIQQRIFQLDNRKEGQFWRLWRRVWAMQQTLGEHFADVDLCPKRIRSDHRNWYARHFGAAVPCAVAMMVVHDNRPSFRLLHDETAASLPSMLAGCWAPQEWQQRNVVQRFISCCIGEAVEFAASNSGNNLVLAPLLFKFGAFRSPSNSSEALSYAFDVVETSLRFTPYVWWENSILFCESMQERQQQQQQWRGNLDAMLQGLAAQYQSAQSHQQQQQQQQANLDPALVQQILPLFRPADSAMPQFVQFTGNWAWIIIAWLLLPRLAIDGDEFEQWDINPQEYMSSQADPNQDLFNIKSAARRVLSNFLTARATDRASKKAKKRSKQQQQQVRDVDVVKTRVHFLVDTAYLLLRQAAAANCASASYSIEDPSAPILCADAGLVLLRVCKKAVCERTDAEEAVVRGVLPLFESRFGPLRAKAAQVASELCSEIQWGFFDGNNNSNNNTTNSPSEHLAHQNFQAVLRAAISLIYDGQEQVRMQVCTRLSPLIRHPLAGTVVVPHLKEIVEQFFHIMHRSQSDTVVATLRKLFAHYREHMAQFAVHLAGVILQRFNEVVGNLMRLSPDDIADEIGIENSNNAEFNQAASAGNRGGGGGGRIVNDENSAIQREIMEATAVGDELLGALSTIVKCVPKPEKIFQQILEKQQQQQQQQQMMHQQLQEHSKMCLELQELLRPTLLGMFEAVNPLGFFEGGLRLATSILSRSPSLHPAVWDIFVALFRVVCVRDATDYFTNMISVLDNFASVDPVGLVLGKSDRVPPIEVYQAAQQAKQSSNEHLSMHPAEGGRFINFAYCMVSAVCSNGDVAQSDAANAVQCIDCFVLNAARIVQGSIVATEEAKKQQNASAASQQGARTVTAMSPQDISQRTESNDPLFLKRFVCVPLELAKARSHRVPQQQQQQQQRGAAASAGASGVSPSMTVLLSNSVLCCVLAAAVTPAPGAASILSQDSTVQSAALTAFTTQARLFSEFGGVGSGNYRKLRDIYSMPAAFRVYDRKLYVLALAQFLDLFCCSSAAAGTDAGHGSNNNNNNNSAGLLLETFSSGGYGNSSDALASGFFAQAISTAVFMVVENGYYDCRMLASLMQSRQEQQHGGGGGGGQEGSDEFFVDADFDSDEMDDDEYGDDDDLTDVTTDEDDDGLGLFDADDEDDEENDDDMMFGEDNDFDEGGGGDDFGAGGNRSKIKSLAAAAAAFNDRGGDDNDDFYDHDDFSENLLAEDPAHSVETPIDGIDEFSVFGQVLDRIMNNGNSRKNPLIGTVQQTLQQLVQQYGNIAVSRMRYDSAAGEGSSRSKKQRNKKKKQLLAAQQQQQQQQGERVFALFSAKAASAGPAASLSLLEFLKQCSTQRAEIENFE